MSETWQDNIELPDPSDANAVVKAFAANPAFRAAEWRELTTEDNPFRRPVRPDDLGWLDYSIPMPAENALKLSGLLGHRMLRNIYDLDSLMLAPKATDEAADDAAAYNSTRNRVLSELAKPVLERHLFTFLQKQRPKGDGLTLDSFLERMVELFERRIIEPGAAFATALSARGEREAATFVLLQYSAFAPAMQAAVARNAIGESGLAHPTLRPTLLEHYLHWVESSSRYANLLAGADLQTPPAAYWQLYLNTSLARGNYLHYLAANRERIFAFLGAFIFQLLDDTVTAEHYAQVLDHGLAANRTYFDELWVKSPKDLIAVAETLLAPLCEKFGPTVMDEAYAGFADASYLADLWDRDLAEQLAWADRIEEYQQKAEKIRKHINDQQLEIDLDTFVESWEVTSTTHVHDEHRLVIIESGQMHFWNNVTHKIELNTGDKLLIPLSRLHGSTVLNDECTYHQPIIPEDMYRSFS